ncbi:chemotaxis protein CheW [bacterium]|nr:chemotaxis protein CheW [bacterium]
MSVDKAIRILMVEDAAVMRRMEVMTLNSLGFQNIIEAGDGDEAIAQLKGDHEFQLIISDWNMPNKSGFELLQWVRSNEQYSHIPFIMATGRGEKKEMSKAKDAGVSSFISKPFNGQELQEKIDIALGLRDESEAIERIDRGPRLTSDGRVRIKMAHIQITDHLVLGVAKHLIKTGKFIPRTFELETECMSSWNPVAKALEHGHVDGAFVLAPIAMDLYGHGADIKLTLFAHKNGSIFVRNRNGTYQEPYQTFFKEKSFYLPHFQSVHHMLAHQFFHGIGLKAGMPGQEAIDVSFEVVPPVQMPQFLSDNIDSSGFLVAEPLGTKAIAAGIAELQFFSSELWENHPCCIVAMQRDFTQEYEEAVFEFTKLLVEAGKFIERKPGSAAEVAVDFLDPDKRLGLRVPLLKNVLTEPMGITTGDLYPSKDDMDRIQHYMHDEMDIGKIIDLNAFIETKFADAAITDRVSALRKSVVYDPAQKAMEILIKRSQKDDDQDTKTLLNMEGKYLIFTLDHQQFGIDILTIREIINFPPVRAIPHSPNFVRGIFNFRDSVIPVIDLRLVLGLDELDNMDNSRLIILETITNKGLMQMGVIVDSVSHVSDIHTADIEETPDFGIDIRTDYILGMAKQGSDLMVLLNTDKVLTQKETHTVEKIFTANAD